jgi:hypothetical protein
MLNSYVIRHKPTSTYFTGLYCRPSTDLITASTYGEYETAVSMVRAMVMGSTEKPSEYEIVKFELRAVEVEVIPVSNKPPPNQTAIPIMKVVR